MKIDDRGAVVQQAFALHQHRQPVRRAQRAKQGHHRHRVGRGDERTKHQRQRQREGRHEADRAAHEEGGEDDAGHGQKQDEGQAAPQLAQVEVERGLEDQRRHEQRQDQLGRQLDLERCLERDQEPDDHQRHGVGDLQAPHRDRDQRCDEQQLDDQGLGGDERFHASPHSTAKALTIFIISLSTLGPRRFFPELGGGEALLS